MSRIAAAPLEIERGEVDGVPLFHMPSLPAGGRTTLSIGFRVGRADEPIQWTGVTHLLEHLLLFPFKPHLRATNGFTAPFRMNLMVRGTPDECGDFVKRLCEVIASPPLERLPLEVPVLRTEPAHRALVGGEGSGLAIPLALNRYGYTGLGKLILPELFLRRPDPAVVREWAARHLVAANAAIWVAGEIPPGLAVDLPTGERQPPPPRWEIRDLRTPTRAGMAQDGVAASFVVDRGRALRSGIVALHERLFESLRVAQGSAYDISHDQILLGSNRQHVSIWIGALPAASLGVAAAFEEELDRLARLGPTRAELDRQVAELMDDSTDPSEVMERLDGRLEVELLGDQAVTRAEQIQRQQELTPEAVAAAVTDARQSMLMLLPNPDARPVHGFFPYPGSVETGLHGARARRFPARGAPASLPFRANPVPRLAVGQAGVWVERDVEEPGLDRPVTRRLVAAPWSEVVAVVPESDAVEVLVRDGSTITIDQRWQDHRRAIRLVDQHAPAEARIPEAPWASPVQPDSPRWQQVRRPLFVAAIAGWMTMTWAFDHPGQPLLIVVGLAFTAVLTLLSGAWLEAD